ncbi:MAG: hypothetical protein IJU58_00485 [Clostridia bacterium]|nr:hypothetical protein [Clostridia bacterium]
MEKLKKLYAKWYAEYVLDGYDEDVKQELAGITTIKQAQDFLFEILTDAGISNYDQIENLYGHTIVEIGAANKTTPLSLQVAKQDLICEFGEEFVNNQIDLVENMELINSMLDEDEEDDIYFIDNENNELTAKTIDGIVEGLFFARLTMNSIIEKIKELEEQDATYEGAKTSDFDNKKQYMAYILEKGLDDENNNDSHKIVVKLVDSEIEDGRHNIVDYYKYRQTYRTNNDSCNQELTLTK